MIYVCLYVLYVYRYKPGFHLVQNLPNLPATPNVNEIDFDRSQGIDLTLSPFLLLPDSFGDIYSGEKFAAYIAIVNGYPNVAFLQVALAVRLQTPTKTIDLSDVRSTISGNGPSIQTTRTVGFNDQYDMIVEQKLSEYGIHTLRVSVSYYLPTHNEVKTLRKFYRFNVLQPLVIQSHFIEVNGRPMVQCDITNATKSVIYIDSVSFVPTLKGLSFTPITALLEAPPLTKGAADDMIVDDLILLQAGDSYSSSFSSSSSAPHSIDYRRNTVGYPVVRWCACMGEFSVFAGDNATMRGRPTALVSSDGKAEQGVGVVDWIKFQCVQCPTSVLDVGDQFDITIRVYNYANRVVSLQLDCKNTDLFSVGGLCFTGLTNQFIGSININDSADVTVSMCAVTVGLFEIPAITFIDNHTSAAYRASSLGHVLIEEGDDAADQITNGMYAA